MIYNDHQLKVTTEAAEKFRADIKMLSQLPKSKSGSNDLRLLYNNAIQQQLKILEAEIADYEQIKSGKSRIKVTSLSDLGINLVKARIRAKMTQKSLAEVLKVSASQINSYESSNYSTITIADLRKVAKKLNVIIPENVIPSNFKGNINDILSKLKKVGLDRKFVLSRLILPEGYEKIAEKSALQLDKYTLSLYKHLKQIFGCTWDQLTNPNDIKFSIANSARVKFKLESTCKPESIDVYSIYALYLAKVVVKSARKLNNKVIPTNAIKVREEIIKSYGSVNLENTLNYAWSCGVIVLPLNNKSSFHGVCMRIDGRNVIILNPKGLFKSTWIFDLLHELYHACQNPSKKSFDEIAEVVTLQEHRKSEEELEANDFATKVLLGESKNDLFIQCKERADGNIEYLKEAIQFVAGENNVMVDVLANYVAYRYKSNSKSESEKYWEIARSLQPEDVNSYQVTRDIFMNRFPFEIKNEMDLDLLLQALEDV